MLIDDQGPRLLAIIWVVATIPVFFVGIRLWVRTILFKAYGWDDTVIVAATVLLVIYAGIITKGVQYGVGKHYYDITDPVSLTKAYELSYVCQPFAFVACALSKSSFGLMLLRIMTNKWERLAVWWIIISVNVFMVLSAMFLFFQCENPAYEWNSEIKTNCWPTSVLVAYTMFAAIYSGFCDVILALWPWVILSRLQMKRQEKAAVGFAMSLGIVAGITAFIKASHLTGLAEQRDFTYAVIDVYVWTGAETGLTVIASCIGTYRPLFKKLARLATGSQQKEPYYVLEGVRSKRSHATPRNVVGRSESQISRNMSVWRDSLPRSPGDEARSSEQYLEFGYAEDGRSDKAILEEPITMASAIQKTTDVIISYEHRRPA